MQAIWMRGVRALTLVAAAGAAACASAQADGTVAAGPPLVVPEAPPRATTAPVAAEAPPVAESAPTDIPVEIEEPVAVPEPAMRAPQPAASPASEAATPEPPLRNLQAGGAAGGDAALASIRTQLRRAARDLAQVDYNALSGAGRLQYEQSRRFSQQAEAALRDQNLAFAATLAEKAAALAGGLAGS